MNSIDHKKLVIQKRPDLLPKPADPTKLIFGRTFTDHMLEIDWDDKHGWGVPRIHAYGPLAMDPASSVLHYAMECFEGMKAFRDPSGHLRLFRPMMNMHRMVRSGKRVALPEFDPAELLECIKALVKLDQDWCPAGRGYSLYIRPTYVSTHAAVGVMMPAQAKIFVILSPVGPYYPTGWKAVKLLCSEGYCRAFPGGTGCYKVGGNYALSMIPQAEAAKKGYQQVLWLYNNECTEVGTMNFFIYWVNEQGKKELVTCPLNDMILPGVTRDSILAIAREWQSEGLVVSERTYTISDVIKAHSEGRLLEAFGTGTAAVVSPVCVIAHQGKDYTIPVDPADPKAQIGPMAKRLYDKLASIQYGDVDHEWTVSL